MHIYRKLCSSGGQFAVIHFPEHWVKKYCSKTFRPCLKRVATDPQAFRFFWLRTVKAASRKSGRPPFRVSTHQ